MRVNCVTDEALRRVRDGYARAGWPLKVGPSASADTRPKGGDSTQIEAPFTSGAVPKADAQ